MKVERDRGDRVRYWETIADRLSASGWSWGCVSAIDSDGQTIWIVDAHRDNGKRFVARNEEKLTAFLELETLSSSRNAVNLIRMYNEALSIALCGHNPIFSPLAFSNSNVRCRRVSNGRGLHARLDKRCVSRTPKRIGKSNFRLSDTVYLFTLR
jgi:hypothetical protein